MTKVVDTKYVQKSLYFLVPLVLPKRHQLIVPKNSYINDNIENIRIGDYKLLISYAKINNKYSSRDYDSFETTYLVKNRHYRTFYETALTNVYVFDLGHVKSDYDRFLRGNYSRFTDSSKEKILEYYSYYDGFKIVNHSKMVKMLKPTLEDLAELARDLDEPVENITEYVSIPDLEKETLDDIRVQPKFQ